MSPLDPTEKPTPPIPKPSPLDPNSFPHIVKRIVSFAERGAILRLRATSRAIRDCCDARLALHLAIEPPRANRYRYNQPEDPMEEWMLCFDSGGGYPIPGLGDITRVENRRTTLEDIFTVPFCTPDDVPQSVRRIVSQTKIVDLPRPPGKALPALAPFLSNLRVVRQGEYYEYEIWDGAHIPLVSDTLILYGQVGLNRHAGVAAFEPQIYPSSGVQQLIIHVKTNMLVKRTESCLASSATHPSSLRDIVVVVDHIRAWSPAPDDLLVRTMIDAVFFRPHFCRQLGTVKYTFILNHAQDRDLLVPLIVDRIVSLIGNANILEASASADAVAQNVEFLTKEEYKGGVGWERWEVINNDRYDASQLDANGWTVIVDPVFADKVERLEARLLHLPTPFSCRGTIPLSTLGEVVPALYIQDPRGVSAPKRLNLPLDETSAKAVYDTGTPSPFGHGSELRFDESYRSAHELKPPNFALTFDPLHRSSVLLLGAIGRAMGINKALHATLSKLNAYSKGGFFKKHDDTPRGDNHIGTLTLCLPSSFTGGELVVRHNDKTIVHDWGTEVEADGQAQISWAFLYSDCEHEVLPVHSGTRITLAYDIFTTDAYHIYIHSDLVPASGSVQDTSVNDSLSALSECLEDPKFLPDGGMLGFGLQHGYPRGVQNDNFVPTLKGGDGAWAQALAAANVNYECVAVYDIFKDGYEDWDEDKDAPTAEHTLFPAWKRSYKNRLLFATRNFKFFWGAHITLFDNGLEERMQAMASGKGVAAGEIIHWVTLPGRYGMKNEYVSHGNEPTEDVLYVAAALVAYVGPVGRRSEGQPRVAPGQRDYCYDTSSSNSADSDNDDEDN